MAGNDVLDGAGGADSMEGGAGDDTYIIDDAGDRVVENVGAGTDAVVSAITFTLGQNLENLTLTGFADINGGGNTASNVLVGNAGDNLLDGDTSADTLRGNGGADTLRGGAGNDAYFFTTGDGQDIVEENDATGNADTITFAAEVTSGAVVVSSSGQDLVLSYGAGDSVTVKNWFDGGAQKVEQVGFADSAGTITSTWNTAQLTAMANRAPTGAVTVNGTATQNQTLTATDTLADVDGMGAVAYQWQSSADSGVTWSAISGATTSSFVLTEAQVGKQVRVNASYTDGRGMVESKASTASTTVLGARTGTAGADSLTGSAFADIIQGLEGDDVLVGGGGDDTFIVVGSSSGVDAIEGDDGIDTILGGDGNDRITLSEHRGVWTVERINAGAGYDIVAGSETGSVLDFSSTQLVGVEEINGGAGNDHIIGSAAADFIVAGAGNDHIDGWLGNDTMYGKGGDDVFVIEGGNRGLDLITGGDGFDAIEGGSGNDHITVSEYRGVWTVERINAGAGYDIVAGSETGSVLDFSSTELVGVEEINGGAGADHITGSVAADFIVAGAGNDRIDGWLGNDTMYGKGGDDVFVIEGGNRGLDLITGGDGFDVIEGGSGNDHITVSEYRGVWAVERINAGAGYDIVAGSETGSVLDFSGTELWNIEEINGGAGADHITGSVAADLIVAGAGNDRVDGWEGDDTVYGKDGEDALLGHLGNDVLFGQWGNDTLSGGAGADTLDGGADNDTYLMQRGDGADSIVESASDPGSSDILWFAADIASDQLWFSRNGNALDVSIIGTSDKVTVNDWYASNQARTEKFYAGDGKTMLESQVHNLVDAMASFAPPAMGQTTLPANYRSQLDPVLAANWA